MMWNIHGALRTYRWKFFYSETSNNLKLYDINNDKYESKNIQATTQEVRDVLIDLYNNWMTSSRFTASYLPIDMRDIDAPVPAPSGEVLEITARQTSAINKPDSNGVFVRFATGTGWDSTSNYVRNGDRVKFDIYVHPDSERTQGLFYTPGTGWNPMYKSDNGINQNEVLLTDLKLPKGVWRKQVVGIGNLAPHTASVNYIAFQSTSTGYYHHSLDNIAIRKKDGTIRFRASIQ